MQKNTKNIYAISQYGPDDYSFWVFQSREDAPVQMDLSRPVQGTLEEVFGQINQDDEWLLLSRTNDYVAYPVQNKEILAEKYADTGYSERGTLEQIYGTLKEDTELYAEDTAVANTEDEEDNEI